MLDGARILRWCGAFVLPFLFVLSVAPTAKAEFNVCNKTFVQANVAVGYAIGQSWYSRGWWKVRPNECVTVVAQQLSSRYYYIYAEDTIGNPFPIKPERSNFCVTAYEKFDDVSRNSCASKGFSEVAFGQIDTGDNQRFTLNLTTNPPLSSEPRQAQQSAPSYQAQQQAQNSSSNDANNSLQIIVAQMRRELMPDRLYGEYTNKSWINIESACSVSHNSRSGTTSNGSVSDMTINFNFRNVTSVVSNSVGSSNLDNSTKRLLGERNKTHVIILAGQNVNTGVYRNFQPGVQNETKPIMQSEPAYISATSLADAETTANAVRALVRQCQ